MPSQRPSNLSSSARKQEEWGSFKDEIRQLYMVQDMTLNETIEKIKENHGINAKSILKFKKRTWKKKLEAWGFDKYVPANEMEFIVEKAEKRSREKGKETVFCLGEIQITSESERVVRFKKRKLIHATAADLDTAGKYSLYICLLTDKFLIVQTRDATEYHLPYPRLWSGISQGWRQSSSSTVP